MWWVQHHMSRDWLNILDIQCTCLFALGHMMMVAKGISIVKGKRKGGLAEIMTKRGEEAQAGKGQGGTVSRAGKQIKVIQKLSLQMSKEQSWA